MDAISISVRGTGEWVIIHRCSACGAMGANRSAGDDDPLALVRIAVRPISYLDRVRQVAAQDTAAG
jgi:hypothetical protein